MKALLSCKVTDDLPGQSRNLLSDSECVRNEIEMCVICFFQSLEWRSSLADPQTQT